jgi:hypothetical protein
MNIDLNKKVAALVSRIHREIKEPMHRRDVMLGECANVLDQTLAALSQSALDIQTLKDENEVLRGQVPKWISVKDRLPITQADMEGKCYETADGLFVLTGSSGVQRSDFAAGNTLGYWGKFSYERDVVTHWLEVSIPALHAEEVQP